MHFKQKNHLYVKFLIEIEFNRQLGKSETCLRRLIINDDGMGIHENCILNNFLFLTVATRFLACEEKNLSK